MDSKEFQKLLRSKDACSLAVEWANGKSWKKVYETCHRGDWLLWLFKKTNPDDLQLLTLAKGHCANTVRHLMNDSRSKHAVDTAIAFGNGVATKEQLFAAAAAAADAAADADSDDGAYAAAAYAAAYAADDTAASAAAYATDDAADDTDESGKITADICRQYLPIHLWNICKKEGGGND